MSILYRSDRATVILGDARDELAELGTESVGLVIVDPPYGVEWQSRRRAETFDVLHGDGAEQRDDVRAILEQAVRVVGQHRHLYVFGPEDALAGLRIKRPVELIWDKGTIGSGDTTAAYGPAHERLSFAVSAHTHGAEIGLDGVPARLRKGTIIRATRPTGVSVRHPSEKPVTLLAELVESSSRAGELVLDPCAGSGSTGVAAILRGRRALLIESHEPYARLAVDRVRAAEELADRMARL